jgi:hypothetical protein
LSRTDCNLNSPHKLWCNRHFCGIHFLIALSVTWNPSLFLKVSSKVQWKLCDIFVKLQLLLKATLKWKRYWKIKLNYACLAEINKLHFFKWNFLLSHFSRLLCPGVNFTNILRAALFSLVLQVCTFKNVGKIDTSYHLKFKFGLIGQHWRDAVLDMTLIRDLLTGLRRGRYVFRKCLVISSYYGYFLIFHYYSYGSIYEFSSIFAFCFVQLLKLKVHRNPFENT